MGSGWRGLSLGATGALLESQDAQRDGRREPQRAGSGQEASDRHDVCREQALKERKKFEQEFRHNPKAVKTVVENWERLITYYDFPARALETLADI
jgi:hypothetical protein